MQQQKIIGVTDHFWKWKIEKIVITQIPLPNNHKCPTNSKHPYVVQSVPGTVLNVSRILMSLNLTVTLWWRYYYYSHFTDEETEAQKG